MLFAIGSSCFAIGPIPAYADAIGPRADAITYFVGSIFFTTAAFLQYVQAVDAPRRVGATDEGPFRLLTWEPHRVDWSSSVVQFVGTLLFNVTTFAAIDQTLTTGQSIRAVWSPDAGGSMPSSRSVMSVPFDRWIPDRRRDGANRRSSARRSRCAGCA